MSSSIAYIYLFIFIQQSLTRFNVSLGKKRFIVEKYGIVYVLQLFFSFYKKAKSYSVFAIFPGHCTKCKTIAYDLEQNPMRCV